ncbi:MAG: hypothetical protein MN733_37310, partial [Nitrososphaera sp.]|nr:hypothetical protein [Nitrososphaera sp.]
NDQLPEPEVHTANEATGDIATITGQGGAVDLTRLYRYLDELISRQPSVIGFDYETTGPKDLGFPSDTLVRCYHEGAKLLTVAFSSRDLTFAVALNHKQAGWRQGPQYQAVHDALQKFFDKTKSRLVAHQLSFELEWTAWEFETNLWDKKWGDSVAQAYLLDERSWGRPSCLSLEFIVMMLFGINIKKLSGVNRGSLNNEPIDSVLTYNGVDARYHRLAWIELNNRIRDEGLIDLYLHHMQRLPTCVLTQLRGVPINQETRKVLSKKYAIRRKQAEDDIQELPIVKKFAKRTGQIFRPSANEDVIAAFRSLGVQLDNTDQNTLNEIDHPLAKAVLTY